MKYENTIDRIDNNTISVENDNIADSVNPISIEEKYRRLFETIQEVYFEVSIDGTITEISPSISNIFGYTREKLIGCNLGEIYLNIEERTDYIDELLQNGSVSDYEIMLKDEDGTPVIVTVESELLHDDKGTPMEIIGTMRESTMQKIDNETLRDASDWAEVLNNVMPSAVFTIDDLGRITSWNRKAAEITGYSEEEIIGKSCKILANERCSKDCSLYNSNIQKPIMSAECTIIDKAGNEHLILKNADLLYDPEGNIIGGIECFEDITEYRRIEDQLQIRQRMDSLGTLAGGIAHDFNNILTGVMGYISMLKIGGNNFSTSHKEYIEQAELSCIRAADLIKKFQTLTGSPSAELHSIDLHDIAHEVFGMLERTTDRLIEKTIDFNAKEFYILADPSELNQVLLNLGTNAIHSIESKGVAENDSISITAENYRSSGRQKNDLDDGDYIHITFRDSGTGMDDTIKAKMFDPFFTTKDASHRKGQGLGLAMVYNIITRKYSGMIEVESSPGEGTALHLYLPKSKQAVETIVHDVRGAIGGTETVLVIDDEDSVRNLSERALKRFGYTVMTAVDGRQGLDMYTEHRNVIDIVLMDITMPRMSGRTAFAKMTEIDPDVKVVISSGHGESEMNEDVFAHAKGFVVKPYQLLSLVETVRNALDS